MGHGPSNNLYRFSLDQYQLDGPVLNRLSLVEVCALLRATLFCLLLTVVWWQHIVNLSVYMLNRNIVVSAGILVLKNDLSVSCRVMSATLITTADAPSVKNKP